jgi:hypothetical protein
VVESTFADTWTDYFVTTGIHSPKKYPKEPFRWAGDWPVKNHALPSVANTFPNSTVGPTGTGTAVTINPMYQTAPSIPLSDFATSFYPTLSTSSCQ